MPQDGSNNYYYPPGTPGVPDTTIESEAYNTFLNDLVVNDLNWPRPVHRGGTASTTADGALLTLGAEKANQGVTNYDTHVWMAGSFTSNYSTPGAPTAGGHMGTALVANTDFITLLATDYATGVQFMRQKVSGTWGSWVQQAGSAASITTNFVNTTGDFMSGALVVTPKGSRFGGAAGAGGLTTSVTQADANILLYDNSGNNWAGVGTDVGGNMWFRTGTSAAVRPSLYLSASDYSVNCATHLNTTGNVVATGNVTGVNVSATSTLTAAGQINGAGVQTTGNIVSTAGWVTAAGYVVGSLGVWVLPPTTYFGMNEDSGNRFLRWDSTSYFIYNTSNGDLSLYRNSNPHTLWRNDYALVSYSSNTYKPGGGAWLDSCDARIKNVEGDYTRGLAEIAQLHPVLYTFKGNDTNEPPQHTVSGIAEQDSKTANDPLVVPYPNSTHKLPAAAGTKFAGLIAQEVETVMPELITQRDAYIDGVAVTDMRDLDTTPLIFALINCIKELKVRVEALENPT